MAEENRSWSYDRIVGALANLRHEVSDQTVSNVLRRHGIPVVPPKKLAGTERAGIATARAIPGTPAPARNCCESDRTHRHQPRPPLARPRQAHRSPRSPRTDLRLVHRRLRRAGPLRRRGAARRSGVTHQRRPSLSRYNCTVGSLGDDHRGPGPSRSPRKPKSGRLAPRRYVRDTARSVGLVPGRPGHWPRKAPRLSWLVSLNFDRIYETCAIPASENTVIIKNYYDFTIQTCAKRSPEQASLTVLLTVWRE
jgi:hypothetical protein